MLTDQPDLLSWRGASTTSGPRPTAADGQPVKATSRERWDAWAKEYPTHAAAVLWEARVRATNARTEGRAPRVVTSDTTSCFEREWPGGHYTAWPWSSTRRLTGRCPRYVRRKEDLVKERSRLDLVGGQLGHVRKSLAREVARADAQARRYLGEWLSEHDDLRPYVERRGKATP